MTSPEAGKLAEMDAAVGAVDGAGTRRLRGRGAQDAL